MKNFEKQLNNLPKRKLGFKADKKIKFMLYKAMLRKRFENLSNVFKLQAFKFVPAALILFLVFTIPGYAYAGDNVVSGHLLYPVRESIEKVELKLAFSDKAKADKYAKLIDRRLKEAEVLAGVDNVALVETIDKAVKMNERAVEVGGNGYLVDQKNIKRFEVLAKVASKVGIKTQEEVIDSVALALESVRVEDENVIAPTIQSDFEQANKRNATSTREQIQDEKRDLFKGENIGSVSKIRNFNAVNNRSESAEAQQSLDIIKNNIVNLKTELSREEFKEEDVEVLFQKLDKRIEKVENAIRNEETKIVPGLIKSTQAVTKNAKYFMKKNENINTSPERSNKSGNSINKKRK